jgi:hypothetical protein
MAVDRFRGPDHMQIILLNFLTGCVSVDKLKVEFLQTLNHFAALTASDSAAINFADRREPRESARRKRFICAVAFREGKIALKNGNVIGAAKVDYLAPCNSAETVVPTGSPNLAFADNEKMR